MLFFIATFVMPPLFVFGLYHLLSWFNLFRINERIFWKRVALSAAISHVILLTGFILFTYAHFRSMAVIDESINNFGAFVFTRSEFWRLILIFDTAPALVVLAVSAVLSSLNLNPPGLLAIAFGITYLVGTLQWYFLGGGIGALLEKFFAGLKTPEDEDEWT